LDNPVYASSDVLRCLSGGTKILDLRTEKIPQAKATPQTCYALLKIPNLVIGDW
jgi:hypothetical protein